MEDHACDIRTIFDQAVEIVSPVKREAFLARAGAGPEGPPNIARVFDGGETAGGQPYFVMELVRGVPIADFCDHNHLDIQDALAKASDNSIVMRLVDQINGATIGYFEGTISLRRKGKK